MKKSVFKLFIVFPMIVMTVLSCEKEFINVTGDSSISSIEPPPQPSTGHTILT